ncbi:MAG: alpha/beta hydrolase, partial [Desulfovibrio sp.]|nr:alpha/beta hydrolase [Desulfovibrio sp.]
MNILPRIFGGLVALSLLPLAASVSLAAPADADNFYKSPTVTMEKVTFPNLYKMEMAGDLFLPQGFDKAKKYPAIIVGHPMGAVKEQSAVLYAQKMAEQGLVTLAMDLAFWGASQGQPRNAVSPDMYAETFSAAVDFLDSLPYVDKGRIGIIGICGSGSFAISAAKIDPRLRAIATVSMYDMGEANRSGLGHAQSVEQRKKILKAAARQRDVEFAGGAPLYTSGTVHKLTPESTPIEREFYDFYRTPRGEVTPPGMTDKTTTHPLLTSNVK